MYYNILGELLPGPLFLYALEEVWPHHLTPRHTVGGTTTRVTTATSSWSCSFTLLLYGHGGFLLHVFVNSQVDAFAGPVVECTLCV